jgi:hypothetical protein
MKNSIWMPLIIGLLLLSANITNTYASSIAFTLHVPLSTTVTVPLTATESDSVALSGDLLVYGSGWSSATNSNNVLRIRGIALNTSGVGSTSGYTYTMSGSDYTSFRNLPDITTPPPVSFKYSLGSTATVCRPPSPCYPEVNLGLGLTFSLHATPAPPGGDQLVWTTTALCLSADGGTCIPQFPQLSTFAGDPNGPPGSADGTGTTASFYLSTVGGSGGLATDSAGNVYVADTGNNTIRKITPAGVVTTLAGNPECSIPDCYTDGTVAVATFLFPSGVAVDKNTGNIYVADSGNHVIRKITPAGMVSTLAGGGQSGADGTGTAAGFTFPMGITVDSWGNIYVADTGDNTIRWVLPTGVVTTLAGGNGNNAPGSRNGTGTDALFNAPTGLATDSVGNIYVADFGNNTIRMITPAPTAEVTTLAGSPGVKGSFDGIGGDGLFNGPFGVAIDNAGNLYVSDTGNDTIREIDPSGYVTTLVGQAGIAGFAAGPLPGLLNSPQGVALYGLTLYTTSNNAIVKVTGLP